MAIEISKNGKALVLPARFSIEWVEHNFAFEGNTIYGDYAIPIDLPIVGNEEALEFRHEINTAEKAWVIDGYEARDNGNLIYTGALAINNSRKKSKVSVVFLVHSFAYFYGKRKLNEVDFPALSLGATDVSVLSAATASIARDKLYCFPPIKVNNFYGDNAAFPATINGNSYSNGSSSYVTEDDFSNPLIPFFFATELVRMIADFAGVSVSGSFFELPRFRSIALSHLACMDRSRNPNDVAFEKVAMVGGSAQTHFSPLMGHNMGDYWEDGEIIRQAADCEIKEEKDLIISYEFELPDFDFPGGGHYEFEFEIKIVTTTNPIFFSLGAYTTLDTKTLTKFSPVFSAQPDIESKQTFRYNTQAADVGKYLFVVGRARIRHYSVYDPEPLNPWSSKVYTLVSDTPTGYRGVKMRFGMRYLGETGSELLDGNIDWNFFMPEMTVEEFLVGLKSDYNLRFAFHPFKNELQIDAAEELLDANIKSLDGKVHEDYEQRPNTALEGFEFVQDFEEEVDEEKEEALKFKEFLGEFAGTGNFPDATFNSYVIDSISNEVYVSKMDGNPVIFGGFGGSFSWVLSHQKVVNHTETLGNGEQTVKQNFLPLFLQKDGANYVLKFDGIGKSRDSGEKPALKGFRSINFFGKEGGWTAPYASHTNVYADGTPYEDYMVLNYDPENPRSIYSLCYAAWVEFMLDRVEFELVLLHNELDRLDTGFRYKLEGALFLIKEVRSRRGGNGLNAMEATAYRIR